MAYRIVQFPRVGSTNDIAMLAAEAGSEPGLVVQAQEQVRGKGRKARDWVSPQGGLWASVVLTPGVPALVGGHIPLAVGSAVAEALGKTGVQVGVRWPNDLMIGDEKVGGILVESKAREGVLGPVVAGMGINVTNPPPLEHATSLAEHGFQGGPREALDRILARLSAYERWLASGDAQRLGEKFMERAWGIGRELLLDGTPCKPTEIAVDGALIIQRPDGTIEIARAGSLRLPGEP
ncbi:MAG: biotin--[acetyl-CoA-carboxylase] ligase [Candidatus Thermoplasmatota archaeon]|nr:biotin--[acetyl-CoA-carboxylase] ligase [Candidatus Thermoplasmatota archaeon]